MTKGGLSLGFKNGGCLNVLFEILCEKSVFYVYIIVLNCFIGF
jgi:hypothetical protein